MNHHPGDALIKERDRVTSQVLLIDSRDGIRKTSPFDFVIDLWSLGLTAFENVHSVALKGVSFPKIKDEDYVLIDIDHFNDRSMFVSSASNIGSGVFGSMYFDSSQLAIGDIKPKFGNEIYSDPIVFNPAMSKLSKLHVTFRKHDGSVVQAADTGNVTSASLVIQVLTKPRIDI
jgi:hypothetical protein